MACRANDLANRKDHRVFGVYFFRPWLPSLGSGLQGNRAQAAHFRLGSILGPACRTYHHSSLGTPELSEICLPHPNNYFDLHCYFGLGGPTNRSSTENFSFPTVLKPIPPYGNVLAGSLNAPRFMVSPVLAGV